MFVVCCLSVVACCLVIVVCRLFYVADLLIVGLLTVVVFVVALCALRCGCSLSVSVIRCLLFVGRCLTWLVAVCCLCVCPGWCRVCSCVFSRCELFVTCWFVVCRVCVVVARGCSLFVARCSLFVVCCMLFAVVAFVVGFFVV